MNPVLPVLSFLMALFACWLAWGPASPFDQATPNESATGACRVDVDNVEYNGWKAVRIAKAEDGHEHVAAARGAR